jgi:hypothetical protein
MYNTKAKIPVNNRKTPKTMKDKNEKRVRIRGGP